MCLWWGFACTASEEQPWGHHCRVPTATSLTATALLPLGSLPWWQLREFCRHRATRTRSIHAGLWMCQERLHSSVQACELSENKSSIRNNILFPYTLCLLDSCCMPHHRSRVSVKRAENQRGLEHCKPCFDLQ